MAAGFNLTGRLILQLANLDSVAKNIQNKLNSITGTINVKINAASITSVNKMASKVKLLNDALAITATNASAANAALNNFITTTNSWTGASKAATKQQNQVISGIKKTGTAAKESGDLITEFGKAGGLAVKRFAAFTLATAGVFGFIYAVQNAVKEAINFQVEMIKISQVMPRLDGNIKGLNRLIGQLSINFGIASSELVEVARIFAQAGERGRNLENILAAVAKSDLAPTFTDMQNTGEGVIAMMNQFNIKSYQVEKALGSINAVAGQFAVESDDIIDAIRRTGGVFAAASKGVSEGTSALNEFIAIFTSIRATTRESADSIATGLRTIFTRIQRPRTIEFLRQYGIELTDLEGNFIGPYKAVEQLGQALDGLNQRSVRYTKLAEELGGFRQIGKTLPLLTQFVKREKALSVAQEGSNSLTQDAEKGMQALARQLKSVSEDFKRLLRDVVESDTFREFADTVLYLAKSLVSLADSIKPLIPLIGAILAVKSITTAVKFTGGALQSIRGQGGAIASGLNAASQPGILRTPINQAGTKITDSLRGGYNTIFGPGGISGRTPYNNLTNDRSIYRREALSALGRDRFLGSRQELQQKLGRVTNQVTFENSRKNIQYAVDRFGKDFSATFGYATDRYRAAMKAAISDMVANIKNNTGLTPAQIVARAGSEGRVAGKEYGSLGASLGRFTTSSGNFISGRGLNEQQMALRHRIGTGATIGAGILGAYLSGSDNRGLATAGGALSGATLGGMAGGPYGAVAGAIAGGALSFAKSGLKRAESATVEFAKELEKASGNLELFVSGTGGEQATAQANVLSAQRQALDRAVNLQSAIGFNPLTNAIGGGEIGRAGFSMFDLAYASRFGFNRSALIGNSLGGIQGNLGSMLIGQGSFANGQDVNPKEITRITEEIQAQRGDVATQLYNITAPNRDALIQRLGRLRSRGQIGDIFDNTGIKTAADAANVDFSTFENKIKDKEFVKGFAFAGTEDSTNKRNLEKYIQLRKEGNSEAAEQLTLELGLINIAGQLNKMREDEKNALQDLITTSEYLIEPIEDLSIVLQSLSDATDLAIEKNKQLSSVTNQLFGRALSGSNAIINRPQINPFRNAGAFSTGQLLGGVNGGINNPIGKIIAGGKSLEERLPTFLREQARYSLSAKDIKLSIENAFTSGAFSDLPEQIKEQALIGIDKLFPADKDIQLQDFIKQGGLKDFSEKYVKVYKDALELQAKKQDEINRILEQQIDFANKRLEVEKKLLEQGISFTKKAQGLGDRRIALTGGQTTLGGTLAQRQALVSQALGSRYTGNIPNSAGLLSQQSNLQAQLSQDPGNQRLLKALVDVTRQLDKNEVALNLLADENQALAAVEKELVNIQNKREAGRGFVSKLLQTDPFERRRMLGDLVNVARARTGQRLNTFEYRSAERGLGIVRDAVGNSASQRESANIERAAAAVYRGFINASGIGNVGGSLGQRLNLAGTAQLQTQIEQKLIGTFDNLAREALAASKALNQIAQYRANQAINSAANTTAASINNLNVPQIIEHKFGTLDVNMTISNNDTLTRQIASEVAKAVKNMVENRVAQVISPLSGETVVG